MSVSRDEIRRLISNAYYDARNSGLTMEVAADKAADDVTAYVTQVWPPPPTTRSSRGGSIRYLGPRPHPAN